MAIERQSGLKLPAWMMALVILWPLLGSGASWLISSNSTSTTATQALEGTKGNTARIDNLAAHVERLESQQVEVTQKLREIETQFCAEDDLRNVEESEQLRFRQMIMKKVFEAEYVVANSVFPVVCDKKPGSGSN